MSNDIRYVVGDATQPIGYVVGGATQPIGATSAAIIHVCNDVGAWGAGFVLAISKRWPEPEKAFRASKYHGLGDCQPVFVGPGLWVINMYAQGGIRRLDDLSIPLRYDALVQCLRNIHDWAVFGEVASIHMPRIGCGLAGGSWRIVEAIIQEYLCCSALEVYVYDLPSGG